MGEKGADRGLDKRGPGHRAPAAVGPISLATPTPHAARAPPWPRAARSVVVHDTGRRGTYESHAPDAQSCRDAGERAARRGNQASLIGPSGARSPAVQPRAPRQRLRRQPWWRLAPADGLRLDGRRPAGGKGRHGGKEGRRKGYGHSCVPTTSRFVILTCGGARSVGPACHLEGDDARQAFCSGHDGNGLIIIFPWLCVIMLREQ